MEATGPYLGPERRTQLGPSVPAGERVYLRGQMEVGGTWVSSSSDSVFTSNPDQAFLPESPCTQAQKTTP